MDTVWFDVAPGDLARPTAHVVEAIGGHAVLLHMDVPDHVRVPEELGGGTYRVLDATTQPCPARGCEHQAMHLAVARRESGLLCVAGCNSCGWQWYEVRRGAP